MDTTPNKSQAINSKKTVIDEILEANNLDLNGLAKRLGVDYRTLWRWRKGERAFRLTMSQIKELDKLLAKIGKRLSDLPPDWILDKT